MMGEFLLLPLWQHSMAIPAPSIQAISWAPVNEFNSFTIDKQLTEKTDQKFSDILKLPNVTSSLVSTGIELKPFLEAD
jgi:hypothetical protein